MKSLLYYLNPSCSGKTSVAVLFLLGAITAVDAQQKKSSRDTLKTKQIEEVVMIGYGTQKKSDVNSSVSSIKTKDIQDLKQISIDQMIQGKVAGVAVSNGSGQAGSAASVRIRGNTSISGTNEPLYVIDGVPISGDATGQSMGGKPIAGGTFGTTGGSVAVSPISFLNPNDIESVDVLKDASATAIYGSRGANGVVIITTKSGKKGTGKISYDTYMSTSSVYKKVDLMNLSQYAVYQNKLADLVGLERRPEFAHPSLLGQGTKWQDEIFRTVISQSHQISFSGGKDNTSYYVSGSYLDQPGVLIGTEYKRYTFKVNFDTQVKDWLRIGTNISAGISNERYAINQSFTGVLTNLLLQAPDMPVYNADGTFAAPPEGQNISGFNPVAEALEKENKLIRKNFVGNFYGEAKLAKGLKYRMEISAATEFSENTEFSPYYDRGTQFNLKADLTERRQNWYSINIKNLLTYDLSLDKHKFTFLLGQEAIDTHWEGVTGVGEGFKSNDIYSLALAEDIKSMDQYKGQQSIFSLLGRVIYDFDNRYSLSASLRRDVSSKFDPDIYGNQVGYFPSVAASWKVTNESFMQWLPSSISNIKLRGGYGETGNQQIPNNTYTALLTKYYLLKNYQNPDLKWETMQQVNLGLDFTLFKNFNFTVDWYNKTSKDLLLQVALPDYITGGADWEGGVNSPYRNVGSIRNTGIDLSVSYNLRAGDFSWNPSLVVSHYKTNILDLSVSQSLIQTIYTGSDLGNEIVTNSLVGGPLGVYWGYKTDGLFQTADQITYQQFGVTPGLGDVKYVDVNGDGKIDANDLTKIGDPNPDFTFGFTNSFKYKNIDLSFFLQGSVGNDVMNMSRKNGMRGYGLYVNQYADAANFWTPENTNTDVPRIAASAGNNQKMSDRFIEDGTYVRLQNVTLGYSISPDFLQKIKVSRLRLYLSAQNLYTWTKYTGYDPEIGSFNQNALLTGIDNGRYPSPRTFSFGLNVDF